VLIQINNRQSYTLKTRKPLTRIHLIRI